MIVCDRCLERKAHEVKVEVRKFDGTNRLGRKMIGFTMTLCEQCIHEYHKSLGKHKQRFMKDGDDIPSSDSGDDGVGGTNRPSP